MEIKGKIVPGHGIASGKSKESPYPKGSLEMQLPIFRERGLDLLSYFPGTINVNIEPAKWRPKHPDYTFENVEWTDNHPPEHFSFFKCQVIVNNKKYRALIYYPHPETKLTHFQDPSIIEILSEKNTGIGLRQ